MEVHRMKVQVNIVFGTSLREPHINMMFMWFVCLYVVLSVRS